MNACSCCVMKVIVSEEGCHDAARRRLFCLFLAVLFVWVAVAVGRWDLPSSRQDFLSCEDWWVHFTPHRQKRIVFDLGFIPTYVTWNIGKCMKFMYWSTHLKKISVETSLPLLHTHSDPAARNQRLLTGRWRCPIVWTIYHYVDNLNLFGFWKKNSYKCRTYRVWRNLWGLLLLWSQ